LTMYLGLAGLAVLMVGGIGVAVSVSAFVHGKRSTIAVLKCLGVSRREGFAIYLGQTAFLGLGGRAVGAVLRSALHPLLSSLPPRPSAARVAGRARDGSRRDAPVLLVAAQRHPMAPARPHLEEPGRARVTARAAVARRAGHRRRTLRADPLASRILDDRWPV